MACYGEKEVACCVRGYHIYKRNLYSFLPDLFSHVLRLLLAMVCGMYVLVLNIFVGKISVVTLFSCKIFSYIFCVRK